MCLFFMLKKQACVVETKQHTKNMFFETTYENKKHVFFEKKKKHMKNDVTNAFRCSQRGVHSGSGARLHSGSGA